VLRRGAMRTRPRSSTRPKPPPRFATPHYSKERLEEELKEHIVEKGVGLAFDFGGYSAVAVTHAVRGTALVRQHDLLSRLLQVAPAAMFLFKAGFQPICILKFTLQCCWAVLP